jgi:hypothetical protein
MLREAALRFDPNAPDVRWGADECTSLVYRVSTPCGWLPVDDLPAPTRDAMRRRIEADELRKQAEAETKTEAFLADRKAAAMRIDPNAPGVKIKIRPGWLLDPYDVRGLHESMDPYGRCWFVATPESSGWVWFRDLPPTTYDELWRRMKAGDFDHTDSDDGGWPF